MKIIASNLKKIYNGKEVVKDISLEVNQGEIVGLWDLTEPEKQLAFI